ncbi:hypothetical protein TNCV_2031971 [Trichonephila clavipes]|nr:hypothetical protein TNCV_2031971 [Trichonephila clavipes]
MGPVQIPLVPQSPVPIPDVLGTYVLEPPVQIPQPPVQIPNVVEPVQIPLVPQSPVQIPDVPEPPLQIPVSQVLRTTCAIPDETITTCACFHNHLCRFPPMSLERPVQFHNHCADSRCPRTCAEPQCQPSLEPPADSVMFQNMCRLPVSEVLYSQPMQILPRTYEHSATCSTTCADSSVTSPTATYADSPRTYEHSTCITTCADCSVTSPTVTCAASPRARHFGALESTDAFDQLMSFVFWTQNSSCFTRSSIFDENLFSFLDEFEREPMDLTMPRVNSCVKKSIGFKPIQPLDLSVNSSIGQ